ncbi:MAG: response regulator transcription factor [Ferruginibacter sp.]
MINVFLVEDHPLVIAGMQSMLAENEEMNCGGTCTTGADLMKLLTHQQPDIILMDINLPDTDGISLCKEVKEKYPNIFIVALTINNQPGIIKKMMENGASGYVLKDAAKHEIIDAIKTAAKGYVFYSHSAAFAMRQPQNDLPSLTRREKEILELIGDGLTNPEIASKLFLDVTTVDSHRKNMLKKFAVKNTAALIKIAIMAKLI